jgi:2'-5' RNA ligase
MTSGWRIAESEESIEPSQQQTMKASLWLLPPTLQGRHLRTNIEQLSNRYDGSAPFEPHITVLGDIAIDSDEHATALCHRLRQHVKGRYGNGIICQFENEIASMQSEHGGYVWNQAFALVVKENESFDRLADHVRSILGKEALGYPPPLSKPHLSLYYGEFQVPPIDAVEHPPGFVATTLALWSCSPSSVQGVQEWREIGSRIELV